MTASNVIINKLLDRYELRVASDKQPSVTISLKLIFRGYPDVNYKLLTEIEAAIESLTRDQYIIPHKERLGTLYEKITLNIELVPELYKRVHRTPLMDGAIKAEELLSSYEGRHPILDNYITSLKTTSTRGLPFVPKDFGAFQNVLKGMSAVLNNREPLLYRQFSVNVFGDSKVFENEYLHAICTNIYAHGNFEYIEKGDDVSLLEVFDILKNPTWIRMKGRALIEINGQTIDISAFKEGISFSSADLADASITLKTDKVFTIENLTTFNSFPANDCFVVYLAGFHNTDKTRFLKNLYNTNTNATYHHFGDIDAGGFYIFLNLRHKTGIPFMPYQMDESTLRQYSDFTKPLRGEDRKRLEVLLNQHDEFRDVLSYMLNNGCKLEQEAVSAY